MKTKSVQSKSVAKIRSSKRKSKNVRIEFSHPTAVSVYIAGTFNDWHPSATDMIELEKGHWVKELTLPPGEYQYRLVVDDDWIPDPQVFETVPNPYGGQNSILRVPPAG